MFIRIIAHLCLLLVISGCWGKKKKKSGIFAADPAGAVEEADDPAGDDSAGDDSAGDDPAADDPAADDPAADDPAAGGNQAAGATATKFVISDPTDSATGSNISVSIRALDGGDQPEFSDL